MNAYERECERECERVCERVRSSKVLRAAGRHLPPDVKPVYSVDVPGKPFTVRSGLRYTKRSVVAFEDRVVVESVRDPFFGGRDSRAFRSRVITNPTWGRLMEVFKQQMLRTRDYHHVFLEGARIVRREVDRNGVSYAVVELLLGS
jgi:hypothetical protein